MQEELAKKEIQDGKQLVLGFDAGCFTCSDLAARIEDRVGDRLAVRNLNDPKVQAWRKEALGEDAKWAPTFFEIEDGKVKAWSGWKMGWALSRTIGPAATWQVMQALGEVGAAPRIEESTIVEKLPAKAADAVVGMSRGRFLKGVGGAAVAMSVLSGSDLLAPSVEAATTERSPYDIISSRKITGTELINATRQVGSSVDVKNLVGYALSTPAKVKAATPRAFMHKLRNGSAQRVIVYNISSSRSLTHVQFSNPPKSMSPSRAMVWQYDNKKIAVVKASEGGALWRVDDNFRSRAQTSGGIVPLGECPPISSNPPGENYCWVKRQVCVDWTLSWRCGWNGGLTAAECAACVAAIGATYSGLAPAVVAIGLACAGCVDGTAGTTSACCAQWCWVQQYNVRPGCGTGPS